MMKTTQQKFFSTIALLSLIMLSACTNMTESGKSKSGTNSLTNPSFVASTAVYSHTMQNVNISALTSGTDLELKLTVNTGAVAFQPLTQFCTQGATSAKPCQCQLTWTEVNTVGGAGASITRIKKLDLSDPVQSGLVKCHMTQAFWNEIPTGTSVRMNIIPGSTNVSGLNVKDLGYKKGSSVAPSGDFVDDTLTPFRNIYRYTCYSKSKEISHEILNSYQETQVTNGGVTSNVNVLNAGKFCIDGSNSSECSTPRSGFSAQSYYRNLFIRSDKLGEINSTNARYDCPKVLESVKYSATTPTTVPSAEQSKYWPLDTTFALATTSSSEWSVGVPAASVLKKSGDPTAVDDPGNICTGSANTDRLQELTGSNGSIAWKCMGYAKKPNADGTCGSIVDSNGRVRPLTRLRRYRIIYPATFQGDGHVVAERPEADQVYVADRLVVNASGVLTGNMIYGPKPCNFSWFDHEGVTNRTTSSAVDFQTNFRGSTAGSSSWPTYRATSKYYNKISATDIRSVNPDGRILPNVDRDGAIGGLITPSCSAAITVYDEIAGVPAKARLLTTFRTRTDAITLGSRSLYLDEMHINPVDAWTPDYVEDTSFKACVPLSDPYIEPPMHFYRKATGTEVAWCSKVYPTQSTYWLDLNSRKKPLAATISARAANWATEAKVAWFTSHRDTGVNLDIYNTCTSTTRDKVCELSLGSTSDPNYNSCKTYLTNLDGAADRCDRTVMFDANLDYRGFPLQSNDDDIKDMLKADLSKDRNYSCNFSVHSNPTKVGTQQPLSNCCGMVGGTALINMSTLGNDQGGHLEPYLNPLVPNIRFCGNPVE